MAYFVYIIKSIPYGRFYCGHCHNINNRLNEHNTRQVKSTQYGIPWIIVHTQPFNTRGEAYRQEMKIKKRAIKSYVWVIADDADFFFLSAQFKMKRNGHTNANRLAINKTGTELTFIRCLQGGSIQHWQ
ncbi:MAG: hypothetical protein GF313_01995 [Caldithrix sp.]|nr:hypothetical protein [Caldithrix sp.]